MDSFMVNSGECQSMWTMHVRIKWGYPHIIHFSLDFPSLTIHFGVFTFNETSVFQIFWALNGGMAPVHWHGLKSRPVSCIMWSALSDEKNYGEIMAKYGKMMVYWKKHRKNVRASEAKVRITVAHPVSRHIPSLRVIPESWPSYLQLNPKFLFGSNVLDPKPDPGDGFHFG